MASESILERTRVAIADQIRPGEVVIAAAKAQLDMRVMNAMRKDPAAGSWADASGVRLTPPIDRESRSIAKTFGVGVVIAVTDQRVLLVDLTIVKHRPRVVMMAIERDQLSDIQGGTRRASFIRIRWLRLQVETPNGPAAIGFEVPKIAARDAEAVLTELGVGGGSESAAEANPLPLDTEASPEEHPED